jgi:hypothetical protein
MSRKGQTKWIVHRTYEPNRLSQAILAQAYLRVVPHHARALRVATSKLEDTSEEPQQKDKRCVK